MEEFLLDEALLDKIIKKVKRKKYTKMNVLHSESVIKNDNELKCYLFHYKYKKNKCEKCELDGFWQNKVLDLLVYRKNKLKLDNRLENIKLLCPNCFSQKNNKSIYLHLSKSKMSICIDCGKRFKKKKIKESINPQEDFISEKVKKHSYIKKRCDICLQIQVQKKDYTMLDKIQKQENNHGNDNDTINENDTNIIII